MSINISSLKNNNLIKHRKDKLVLIDLGATVSALSYDLAKENYWVIDIGHIDLKYCWFLNRNDCRLSIEGKWFNEFNSSNDGFIGSKIKLY